MPNPPRKVAAYHEHWCSKLNHHHAAAVYPTNVCAWKVSGSYTAVCLLFTPRDQENPLKTGAASGGSGGDYYTTPPTIGVFSNYGSPETRAECGKPYVSHHSIIHFLWSHYPDYVNYFEVRMILAVLVLGSTQSWRTCLLLQQPFTPVPLSEQRRQLERESRPLGGGRRQRFDTLIYNWPKTTAYETSDG